MFCRNCGNNIPDNAHVCGYCGTPVGQSGEIPTGAQMFANIEGQEMLKLKSSKKVLKVAVLAVAAVVIIGIVVLTASKLLGGSKILGESTDDLRKKFVYWRKNALYYVDDVEKGKEGIRIAKMKDDSPYPKYLYSSDMKYFYFVDECVTEEDEDGYVKKYGILYRVPLSKVSDKQEKNKELLEEVDSDVDISSITVLEDGTAVYIRKDKSLYWYNGEDSIEVMEDVLNCFYNEKKNEVLCWVKGDDNEGYRPYYIELDGKKSKETAITDEVDGGWIIDANFVLYSNYTEDGLQELGVAGISRDSDEIADEVYRWFVDEEFNTVYYITAKNENGEISSSDVYKYVDGKEPVRVCINIDVDSLQKIDNLLYYTKLGGSYYRVAGGDEHAWEEENVYDIHISEDGTQIAGCYLDDDEEYLWVANLSGRKVTDWKEIADGDIEIKGWLDNTLYYLENVESVDNEVGFDISEGTLCAYENGKNKELADKVGTNINIYHDNFAMCMNDYRNFDNYNVKVDLHIYDKKWEKRKVKGVLAAIMMNENELLYLTDDNELYFGEGKKDDKLIAEDVDGVLYDDSLLLESVGSK